MWTAWRSMPPCWKNSRLSPNTFGKPKAGNGAPDRPTSAYERGQRYASRLQNEFAGNISALADAENISRKIITRCINTAKLPKSVVAFSLPGELSARSGDALQKPLHKEELLKQQASNLHEQKSWGDI